jgi:hypothetical protein
MAREEEEAALREEAQFEAAVQATVRASMADLYKQTPPPSPPSLNFFTTTSGNF